MSQYESEHTLPPLCGALAALQVTPSSGSHTNVHVHVHVHTCTCTHMYSCTHVHACHVYTLYMYMCNLHVHYVHVYMCIHTPGPSVSSNPRTNMHPHLLSERELLILTSKAHLILRSIQLKIGHDLLMQVNL